MEYGATSSDRYDGKVRAITDNLISMMLLLFESFSTLDVTNGCHFKPNCPPALNHLDRTKWLHKSSDDALIASLTSQLTFSRTCSA